MKKNAFVLCALAVLALMVAGCDDADTTPTDTPQPSNPLVGEWREVGSNDIKGISVVFTDTTFTALAYDYKYSIVTPEGTVCREFECYIRLFNNARYLFLDNDTLEILDKNVYGAQQDYPYKTPIVFHSQDTLEIEVFLPTSNMTLFPKNFNPITIYRR